MNRRQFLLVITAAGFAASCSGSDISTKPESSGSTDGERPMSSDEAARMAETLFLNYDLGGATFDLNAQLPDGSSLRLTGEIDWKNHIGHASVAASADATLAEVYWGEQSVLERRPQLIELATATGRGGFEFVARAPDPSGRHIDALLGVITGLASTQRDNALLIQQTEGSVWLRADTLRDTPLDVLRYGDRNRYWLDETGLMLRFEGNTVAGNRPFVIDLLTHEVQEIPGPMTEQVVEIAAVQELYEATTASG